MVKLIVKFGFAVLVLSGCGHQIDPAFKSSVLAFVDAGAARGRRVQLGDLTVKFGDPGQSRGGESYGFCDYNLFGQTITISKAMWNAMPDDDMREAVVLHELGHCILGRGHETDVKDGVPVSIMYPDSLFGWQLRSNREKYLDELFTGGR